MVIEFHSFDVDESIVAPVIYRTGYGDSPHRTTNLGVVLPEEVGRELRLFLSGFNDLAGVKRTPYYRIDAYFDKRCLTILEINAAFVDGWGTALNLSRASSIMVDGSGLNHFPNLFATVSPAYQPELELLVDELAILGITGCSVCEPDSNGTDPIYIYGRAGSKSQPYIRPYDGLRLDNKLNLGLFSRIWEGDLIKIPRHYIDRFDPWTEIPQKVVLKFCDKGSKECDRAGHSVIFNKPPGKARFLKRCYREEALLAQGFVSPIVRDKCNCQLVILAIGEEPIAGYVQYSRNQIITDDSTHGPLWIK